MRLNQIHFTVGYILLFATLTQPLVLSQGVASLDAKSFADLEGLRHHVGNGKPIVLVFINAECPIANAYQPSLQKLKSDFSKYEIDYVMIHADPTISVEAARTHRKDYSINWSVAIDHQNAIARQVSAKVTPEAFLIDSKGNILYQGRIDDRYPEYGKKRSAPTREDLRIAMEEFVSGKQIAIAKTTAIGCLIRIPKNQGDK
jgi:thiol-disulfide isomerase/thioredoxin